MTSGPTEFFVTRIDHGFVALNRRLRAKEQLEFAQAIQPVEELSVEAVISPLGGWSARRIEFLYHVADDELVEVEGEITLWVRRKRGCAQLRNKTIGDRRGKT